MPKYFPRLRQNDLKKSQKCMPMLHSALQNPNLPNVTTLNNPPKVSPAPSVKPNPNANLPRPVSPTPAAGARVSPTVTPAQ